MHEHAEQGGHAVGWQLHDKGRRLSLDDGGAQQLGHQQGKDPAGQHDEHHDRGRLISEKGRRQQQKYRQLGSAAHIGQGQQGRQLFLGAAQGARGHGAWNGAAARNAAGNDIGHDRGPVQAKGPEDAVHHVGNAGHVAAVFHEGNKRKHDDDERRKAQHPANAADDAIHHQRLQVPFGNDPAKDLAQGGAAILDPALGIGPDLDGGLKHHIKHGQHDERAEKGIGQHLVQLVGQGQAVLALILAQHAVTQQAADIAIAGIGDVRFHGHIVRAADVFRHLAADGLQLVGGRSAGGADLLPHFLVAFHELDGHPAGHIAGQQVFAAQHALHGGNALADVGAVVHHQRLCPVLPGQLHGLTHGLVQPFAGARHGRHDRNAHLARKLLRINMDAGLAGLVHHVADQQHRQAHFHHLHRQQQVALQRRGVHHVDDGMHVAAGQLGPGHDLFLRISREGIGARQIHQGHGLVVMAQGAFLAVNRYAGIIAHMLPRTGIGIENRGFAAVGVAGQGNAHPPLPQLNIHTHSVMPPRPAEGTGPMPKN